MSYKIYDTFSKNIIISRRINNLNYKYTLNVLSNQIQEYIKNYKDKQIFIIFLFSGFYTLNLNKVSHNRFQQDLENYIKMIIEEKEKEENNIFIQINKEWRNAISTKNCLTEIDMFINKQKEKYSITIKFIILPEGSPVTIKDI